MSLDKSSAKKSRLHERILLMKEMFVEMEPSKTPRRKAEVEPVETVNTGLPIGAAITYTHHAQFRLPQRSLTPGQVEYVITHGTVFHCAGAVIVHLRRKDVRAFDGDPLEAERLIGTTVVLDLSQMLVLTVYRNRQEGLRRLKRKPRESQPWLAHYTRHPL